MPTPTGAKGVDADVELEELDATACWDLVRSRSVGRFAVNRRGSCPLVVPVNYAVESPTSIVFRSGPGSKLNVEELDLVALQVDEIDPFHHTGWSVLVAGRARWLYEEVADVAVDTWVPGELPYVIRIIPTEITGRRIQLHQADTDPRGLPLIMEIDRNGLEVLDRAECLRLLSDRTLGRVAFTSGALPNVLPVNFHLDGERILLRTRRGGRLEVALRDAVVAFEVDDVDPSGHAGWSIAVTGVASEISATSELDELRDELLERWSSAPSETLIAISTDILSGRRLTETSGPDPALSSAAGDRPLEQRP